ncbi:MAG: hypothetical protein AAF362_03705 [Pseudomonadota bacterium]
MNSGFEKRNSRSRSREASSVENARRTNRDWAVQNHKRKAEHPTSAAWKRQTWTLPRDEARSTARAFLKKYPRAAYWSEVESWRVLPDDRIEFTMRRLPSAD